MSKSNVSHQCRAGYCVSGLEAGVYGASGLESSAQVMRRQLIKAYLRRPLLGGLEAGDDQPVSLADRLERIERMLEPVDTLAA